jgi:hypothetical protein
VIPPTRDVTRCNARGRGGRLCRLRAGWGTDHVGFGYCRFHSGATPTGRKYAARLIGRNEAATLVDELDIDPDEALAMLQRKAAAMVVAYTQSLAEVEEPITENGVHFLVSVLQEAMVRAARLAKLCVDAGIDERRVRLVEELTALFSGFVGGIREAVWPHLDDAGRRAFSDAAVTGLRALSEGRQDGTQATEHGRLQSRGSAGFSQQ